MRTYIHIQPAHPSYASSVYRKMTTLIIYSFGWDWNSEGGRTESWVYSGPIQWEDGYTSGLMDWCRSPSNIASLPNRCPPHPTLKMLHMSDLRVLIPSQPIGVWSYYIEVFRLKKIDRNFRDIHNIIHIHNNVIWDWQYSTKHFITHVEYEECFA